MNRLGILLHKELLESWRTYRLPIVGGLFLFVGLTSPLLAKFLPEIIKAAGGDQLGNVPSRLPFLPTPSPSSGRTSPSSGRSPRSSWRWARSPPRRTAAPRRSCCRRRRRGVVLRRQGGRHRARARHRHGPRGHGGLDLYRDPVRAAARRRVGRAGGSGLARRLGLGGADVPRQHGHRLGRGSRRGRVRGPPRAVVVAAIPNVGRFLPGGLAEPAIALASGQPVEAGDALVPAISTAVLIGRRPARERVVVPKPGAVRSCSRRRQTTPRARRSRSRPVS